MLAFFDTKNLVQPMRMQRLDARGSGTQTVFGHHEFEVRVVLAQLGKEVLSGVALTIVFLRTSVVHDGFWQQGHDGPAVRMDKRRAQHLMRLRHAAVAVDLL